MKPSRRGQIAKFQTRKECENLEKLYVIVEYLEDNGLGISIAKLQLGNSGLKIPPISYALVEDLEVDDVQTAQLDYYLKYGDHDLF
ncbi:hypothetical protein [Psychroserpens damuponensis]|uniref:hypothetical protein n=1 Tax=Psychroserpens damuponensis TaxID=943936 RepID=UPI00059137EA|nr:hypothetical protein [Psychroserpens damuponensis]